MSSFTVTEHVMHNGVPSRIKFDISPEGCVVTVFNQPRYVGWAGMDDVEALADLFADALVKEFRVIVLQLGKIHANKDVYLGLIEE